MPRGNATPMEPEQLAKIRLLQGAPGVAGVFVIDSDSRILDCSSTNKELLKADMAVLFQNAVAMTKQINPFDDPQVVRLVTGEHEYQVSLEAGRMVVVVRNV